MVFQIYPKHQHLIPLLMRRKNRKWICHIRNFGSSVDDSQQPVRTRFAPSPTGFLHLGGLRTALYNYLFAKSHGGSFILRIEDTDQKRLIPNAVEEIEEMLSWSGIIPDEGPAGTGAYGPYLQSERLDIYKKSISTLLENGSAYRCFCTSQRLTLLRKNALKAGELPRYDNKCRHHSADEVQRNLESGVPHVIRFKITPNANSFHDVVMGDTLNDVGSVEGDPVLIKSDGYPTYHFANVVDDHMMKISHVLRGQEWINSTNKHILLYEAFGWKTPKFAHLPLLLNSEGKKFSKRFGEKTTVRSFKDDGILPEALVNFLTFAGSGFENNRQIMTLQEMIEKFALDKVTTHSAVLEMSMLGEVNRSHIIKLMDEENERNQLLSRLQQEVEKQFDVRPSKDYVLRILQARKEHIHRINDLVDPDLSYLWVRPAVSLTSIPASDLAAEVLSLVISSLEKHLVPKSNSSEINGMLKEIHKQNPVLKWPAFMKTVRAALSNKKEGPGVAEMIQMLGKEESLNRLSEALSAVR